MANTLLVTGSESTYYVQSTTISFVPIGVTWNGGSNAPNLTESQVQVVQRNAGVFSNLSANCIARTGSTVIQLRKGGVTQATPTITIAGTGQTADTTHTATVTAGDLWNYTLSAVASTLSIFSLTFAATTNTVCRLVAFPGGSTGVVNVNYNTLSGFFSNVATLATAQTTMEKAGIFKFLAVNIASNTAAASSFIRTAVGATPTIGNCSVALNGAGTGIVEDTTHTDTVSVADLWTMRQDLPSGACGIFYHAIDFISTSGDSLLQIGNVLNLGFVKSVTRFLPLGGNVSTTSTDGTETNLQAKVFDTYVYSNAFVNCFAFINADTVQLRANAAQAGSISISVAGTGNTGDTTHTYTAAATDLMDFQIVTGATTGTRKYSGFWVHANLGGGPVTPTFVDAFVPRTMVIDDWL